jgi:signal transduction histidine kinase
VVAEAAHELRLPVANIKLLVETLLDGALDDREVCKRMLKRAHQEVDRLESLVSDILALEQVSERRHDLKCEWVSLKERAGYAVESISKQVLEKSLTVNLEIDKSLLIYANKSQLDQVLINLLENAAKFTNTNGKITVRGGEKPGTFSIEDTGVGMPESEIPKIFCKFYRIDKSVSKRGTGLGLSIVKQVLDLHGAKISVRSQEGVGSCFELEFPAKDRSAGKDINKVK